MRPKKQSPCIFKYNDYRRFLRDLYEYTKKTNPRFTFRAFSSRAGLSSPSALKEVMDGKKNLSPHSVLKFAAGFGLNKSETEYFQNLVYFNQGRTEQEKNRYYQALLRFKQVKKGKTLTSRQYQYYSNWHNSAVRELAGTKDFKNEPAWIARQLTPEITPAEAQKAVDLLIELGLLKKDENGALRQDVPRLEVDPDVTSLSIRNFNRSMVDLGREAIERFPQESREVSGLTLGVSKACAMEIKEMVREFKKKILNHAVNDARAAEAVYQLNFQLFPLTREPEDRP